MIKTPKVQWLKLINLVAVPASPATSSEDPVYFFGWDGELHQAYRVNSSLPANHQSRDYTKDFVEPADAGDESNMLAKWPGGTTWEIPCLTVAMHRLRSKGRQGAKHPAEFEWEGVHKVESGHVDY